VNIPLILLASCLAFVTGCEQSSTQGNSGADVQGLSSRIAALEIRTSSPPTTPQNNAELTIRLSDLESRFEALSNRVNQNEWMAGFKEDSARTVTIDPDDKGYGKIETDLGPLFISTASVEPYLDGYKMHLLIGNPSSASYSDFKLVTLWGPLPTNNMMWDKWNEAQKARTNSIISSLVSGAWTPVDITLTPALPAEIRNVRVRVELSKVHLRALAQ